MRCYMDFKQKKKQWNQHIKWRFKKQKTKMGKSGSYFFNRLFRHYMAGGSKGAEPPASVESKRGCIQTVLMWCRLIVA